MEVSISGQKIEVGKSLQEYVEERIIDIEKKYFDHAPNAHVNFTKQNYEFICDIIVNDGTGRHTVVKARGASDEVYSAFDNCLAKISKQLRKYKSKLKDRNDRTKLSEINPASAVKYIIDPKGSSADDYDKMEVDIDNPVIVAEKPAKILKLSVGEAVMHMDLENLPALMFENVKTGKINIVYYRADGNISWVESN